MTAPAGSPAEEKAIEFSSGLYGFEGVKRFIIADVSGGGDVFKQLLSLEKPGLGFTLVHPGAFFPDYEPDIAEGEIAELGAERPDDLVIMCIANVPDQFKEATANLKAPIIFNPHTLKARQVILDDDRYTTRHRLFKA